LGAKAKRVGNNNVNESSLGDMVLGQQLTQNNSQQNTDNNVEESAQFESKKGVYNRAPNSGVA
jgi:hypothetical protein